MADSGRQKWSSETGGWVEDTGEVESLEAVAPPPEPKPRTAGPARPATRGFDSVTMQRLPQVAMALLGAGILAIIILTVFMIHKPTSSAPAFEDLGPGVSNVAGLKGHLVTRWQKSVQYQLKFEPLFSMYNAAFSYTVGHPPDSMWVNIRLLDSTGFALCGKQIEFRVNPARTNVDLTLLHAPAARLVEISETEPGTHYAGGKAQTQTGRTSDTFQNILGDNGQIVSVYAQGVLPCSADQYGKFNYWDFTTNFPSTDEQVALMKAPAIAASRAAAAAHAAERQREARSPHYFVEGDTTVRDFDLSTASLESGTGQSFIVVKKNETATANSWAANNAQIHYKCDTLANCVLTRAGDGRILNARSLH
jgi:hypothetical protein